MNGEYGDFKRTLETVVAKRRTAVNYAMSDRYPAVRTLTPVPIIPKESFTCISFATIMTIMCKEKVDENSL